VPPRITASASLNRACYTHESWWKHASTEWSSCATMHLVASSTLVPSFRKISARLNRAFSPRNRWFIDTHLDARVSSRALPRGSVNWTRYPGKGSRDARDESILRSILAEHNASLPFLSLSPFLFFSNLSRCYLYCCFIWLTFITPSMISNDSPTICEITSWLRIFDINSHTLSRIHHERSNRASCENDWLQATFCCRGWHATGVLCTRLHLTHLSVGVQHA